MTPDQTKLPEKNKPAITIVGGGMVGISLALLLAAENIDWRISLIEALPIAGFPNTDFLTPDLPSYGYSEPSAFQPSFDDRSTVISAGSIPLLQRINCWQALAQQAATIKQVHISDRGHYAGNVFDADQLQQEQLGAVIENRWLGEVLSRQLRQWQDTIHCLAPASVTSLQPVPCGVEINVKQGDVTQTLFSDLVVIADGEHSLMRQYLGIEVNTHNYHQTAVIANVTLSQPHKGVAYEHFTDRGPLALLPLSDCDRQARAALIWIHRKEQLQNLLSWDDQVFIDSLQQQFGYRAGKITGVGKRQSYPLQLMQAAEQVRSNIVIMGNAAHYLHPVAGQGFNLSLRDCAALTDILSDACKKNIAIGGYKTLATYQRRRSLDQQITVGLTDQLAKQFSSQHLLPVLLRQLGLLSLNAAPAAHRYLARQLMGQQAY